jgi:hypothetical protein
LPAAAAVAVPVDTLAVAPVLAPVDYYKILQH